MRALLLSSFAALAFVGVISNASASDGAARAAAVQMCRAEIAIRAGIEESAVRMDQVQERTRLYRIDFDIWNAAGELTNVRCDVARGEAPTISALNLPQPSAQASR